MARHTGTTDLDPRSTTMLSTAELDRLQAALGACRAHGCDCTSYEAAGKVGNYPTCKCGHSENVHNHSDGEAKPRKRKASLITCTRCPRPAVWRVLGPYAGDTSTVRCEEHLAQAKAQWPDAIVQPLDDDAFFAQGHARVAARPGDTQRGRRALLGATVTFPDGRTGKIMDLAPIGNPLGPTERKQHGPFSWSRVTEDPVQKAYQKGIPTAKIEACWVASEGRVYWASVDTRDMTVLDSFETSQQVVASMRRQALGPDAWPMGALPKPEWNIAGQPYWDGVWIEVEPDVWYRGADTLHSGAEEIPSELIVRRREDGKWAWGGRVLTFIGAPHENKPTKGMGHTLEQAKERAEKSLAKDHEFMRRYNERQRAALERTHGSLHTALGETRMPAEVDTLREDSCPICGADDYRGDTCNSCGFVRPPVIFHDPDTQKARAEDLREPPTPVDLACDACGAVFPATTEQTATASRHHAAFPEDLEKDKATGTTTDQSDPQTTAEPEQAEPTAAEKVRQHQQGDLCPSCGKGTLMPKSEVNGVEADEDQVVSEDGEIEEPASEGGGGYTLLPKDDPQAILDLVGGGAPKVASVRTATIPSPYEDEEPKKKPEPADDTGSGGPEPEVEAEANPVDAGTDDEGGEKAGTDVQADVPEEVEDAAPEADEAPEETTEDVVEEPVEGESEEAASGGLSDPAGVGPSDGYLVVDTASAQTFDLATVTADEIAAYTAAHPEGYLGGTVSGGQLTLEVSTHVTDPDQATGGTVWDVAAGTKVEPEETPQQVAAALTRRLLSYRRPVRCAPTGTERVEEPIPHRLSGRTQKEQSMSTQNPERGGDPRRQPRPQRRQASAEGRPQRPRQGLHQTLSAMEQRMDRMASVIQRQAGEIKELRTGTRVLAAQNEVLRTAALALSETDGSEAALKATAGLRKAAEQGGAKNGEDVALTDESAAAPEATTSVDSDETVATGDVTPDATTDLENTQVAEDQGALNELTDVTQAHPQTGDATGEVQVQKSAPATTEEANPIEESGWTTASKTDSDDERTWAAMHLASVRKSAGLTNEETMVLAQRLTKDASITVEAMETEAKTLEQVMATKEGSRRPGRNLVPRRADGGAAPSLAGARTASAEEPSGGDVDVSDAFI